MNSSPQWRRRQAQVINRAHRSSMERHRMKPYSASDENSTGMET